MSLTPEPVTLFLSAEDLMAASAAVVAQRKRARLILAASTVIALTSTAINLTSTTGLFGHHHCPDSATYAVHDLRTGNVYCDSTPRPVDPQEDTSDA